MNKKVDLTNAAWAKSDLSNGGDNCLEVASVAGIAKGQHGLLLP